MPILEGTSTTKWAIAEYDFAIDGGATSSITLRGVGPIGATIPSGSIIIGGHLEVLTLLTTGTAAQMALNSEGAGDLVAATVVSGAPYSTTGFKVIVPTFAATTAIKTTAARSLVATITVGTVTAGKFRLRVAYI